MDETRVITEAPKEKVRKRVDHVFKWLLFYNLFILILSGILAVFKLESGAESIIATLCGVAFIYLLTRRKWPVNPFEKGEKKMTGKDFLLFFCLIALNQLIVFGILLILDAIGLRGTSIDIDTNTVSMFIYASFTGPFCEEMVYRGFACGKLRKNGKMLAVTLSALAFGLMHFNVCQFVVGTLTGLVFGYIFIEYSIWWTILFHVINNFVLSVLPSAIFKNVPMETIDTVEYGIMGVFAVIGIVLLIKRKDEIKAWFKDPANRSEKGTVREALKSFWFWVFVVIYAGIMVLLVLYPDAMNLAAGANSPMAEAAIKALPLF